MTLAAARERLRAALATIPNLRAYAYMPADPHPPCAAVLPASMEFNTTFGGGFSLGSLARTYAGTQRTLERAGRELDDFGDDDQRRRR